MVLVLGELRTGLHDGSVERTLEIEFITYGFIYKTHRAPTESSTQRSGRLGYLCREVGLDSGAADDLLELLQRDRVVTWLGSGLGSGLGLRLGQGLG